MSNLVDQLALLLEQGTVDLHQLSEQLNISTGAVIDLAECCGAQLLDSRISFTQHIKQDASLKDYREAQRLSNELSQLKAINKRLNQALAESESRGVIWEDIQALPASNKPLRRISPTTKRESTVVLMASDWHVGERVDPETINNLNEYTPEIASDRAVRFFQNAARLIKKESTDVPVKQIILWLGGDLITGYIHEELEESNYLSPTEEAMLVQELVMSGIRFLQKELSIPIQVVCNFGNHGRTTKKKRAATGAKNSYEWMLYQHLARRMPELEWSIASGYFQYVQVYNQTLRFHHGDSVRYQGGIGGITIPLTKYCQRVNAQRPADLDIVGHFHQLFYSSKFAVNGSLIGPSAYGVQLGYSAERPQQGFLVLDSLYGLTTCSPILVSE